MLIKRCISETYFSTNIKKEIMLPVSVDGTLTSWKEFRQFEQYLKLPRRLLWIQVRVVLQNRYRKVTRMMAEGSRKQLTLCNKLKLHLSLRN